MITDTWIRAFRHDQAALLDLLSVLDTVSDENVKTEIIGLLSHSVAALELWISRIKPGAEVPEKVWPEYTPDEMKKRISNLTENWIEVVRELEKSENSPMETLTYSDTTGNHWTNRKADIIQHVLLHGQHHRAQVALLLRNSGVKPPPTDFISNLRRGRV